MDLSSYTCELCILQKMLNVAYIFLRCNFPKACWNSIGILVITTRPILQIIRQIKNKLTVPFFMEGIDPSVKMCKSKFKYEFSLLLHGARPALVPSMNVWLHTL
uniref:Uncharacterized protein n=1 Tax=Setaria viridis TaxID=4556 RepID=A0A4U6W3A2_SETVI|nr:hypothetical protein SEVIR_1G014900v2 [Setaria viridis]